MTTRATRRFKKYRKQRRFGPCITVYPRRTGGLVAIGFTWDHWPHRAGIMASAGYWNITIGTPRLPVSKQKCYLCGDRDCDTFCLDEPDDMDEDE